MRKERNNFLEGGLANDAERPKLTDWPQITTNHKMKLIKKGDIYHAAIKTAEGSRRTITTRCTDKTEAQRVAKESGIAELERAAKSGRLTHEAIGRIVSGKKITMEKALASYADWMHSIGRSPKTIHNNVTNIQTWLKQSKLGALPPAAIHEQHIDAWINNQDSASKAGTRDTWLAAIRSFFGYCSAKGWCAGDPAQLVQVRLNTLSHAQKEKKIIVPFNAPEITRLLKYLQDTENIFWRFAVKLSSEIALRLGDICQLEWDCITPDGLVVWTDKRDRRICVPISDELIDLLTQIPIEHAQYLFPKQREMTLDPKRRPNLSITFTRLCEKAGLPGKSFHQLRHARITQWAKEGRSLESIGKDVGHSSTSTTKNYVHE